MYLVSNCRDFEINCVNESNKNNGINYDYFDLLTALIYKFLGKVSIDDINRW